MTDIECGTLQDRMPDVAAGQAEWTAAEAAHLASCESCALEWRIVSAARHLGDSAPAIDTTRMAAQVITGVRAAEKRSRWVRTGWVSGLAAAAVVVVMLRVNLSGGSPAIVDTNTVAVNPVTGALPMAELDALDEDQLEAVLEHLDAAAGSLDGGVEPRIGDLDDQQLERVLSTLEG